MSALITKRYVLCVIVVWCFALCNASRVVKGSNARDDALRGTTLEAEFRGRRLLLSGIRVWHLPPPIRPAVVAKIIPEDPTPVPIAEAVATVTGKTVTANTEAFIPEEDPSDPPPPEALSSDSCGKRSNVGPLCIQPQSSSVTLKQYVDGAGYGDDVVHTVSVLLELGVPFKIETNGVKFVLSNMVSCKSSAKVTTRG